MQLFFITTVGSSLNENWANNRDSTLCLLGTYEGLQTSAASWPVASETLLTSGMDGSRFLLEFANVGLPSLI